MSPDKSIRELYKGPTRAEIEEWLDEGRAEALDDCIVEPDGTCPHGSPSWLIELGLI